MQTRIAISPSGNQVIHAAQEVRLVTPAGASRVLPAADWIDVAAFDDEAWVLDSAGWLHRFGLSGEVLGDQSITDQGLTPELSSAPSLWLNACRSGSAAAALLGPVAGLLVRDCGELVVELLRPAPELALSLGGRDWLLVLGGRLHALRGGRTEALPGAPDLTGSQLLGGTALSNGAAALVVRQGEHTAVLVVDVKSGELRRRCELGAGRVEVRIAGQRGVAYVLNGASEVSVIDLRFGKVLHSARDERTVLDLAVDARGAMVALLTSDGLAWAETRRLFDRTTASGRLGSVLNPEPATAATPALPPVADLAEVAPASHSTSNGVTPTLARPVATDRPSPSRATFPRTPLAALAPRSTATPLASGPAALRHLERHLALVGAWAKLAVCEGWDSGRLAFAAAGALPFEHELGALVDGSTGRATERLARARDEAQVTENLHDLTMAGRQPASDTARDGASAGRPPLAALAAELGLSRVATDILLVVAAPAIWGELSRLYAIVANDKDRPLCDEWLVSVLLAARAGRREIAAELGPDGALIRLGLVTLGAGGRPFAALSAHPLVIDLLYGDGLEASAGDAWVTPRDANHGLEELTVDADLEPLLRALTRVAATPARIVIRGGIGSGRTSLLAALAARAGRRLGRIDVAALALGTVPLATAVREALRRATLRGWLPCLSGCDQLPSDDPGQLERVREVLDAHPGPLGFRCARAGVPPIAAGHLMCDLGPLAEGQRLELWQTALARRNLPDTCADSLAARFQIGPGVIARVVASLDAPAEHDDLEATLSDALRQHRDHRMSKVASRVTRLATWSNLILPGDVTDSVREFIGRVRHRRTVFERWGFDRVMTSSRGLTALFQGGPGTGKTMVAGVIARELGCDLYRIDLSSVMSKWVGETERNLGQLFDAAEDGQAILLFDEADSLFAKRTEVKSSNDRFANLEVNYLLQRLDSFEGIAILTTNMGGLIDPAFRRRLSLRLTFPFPDEDTREQLWRVHLPHELPIQAPLDSLTLARKYQLSGGYIRNITLRAAFLAAHEGAALGQDHLERAVGLEYREMGKLISSGTLE